MNIFWVVRVYRVYRVVVHFLGGGVWWQIYFGWWWVMVDSGGSWWVVAQFSLTPNIIDKPLYAKQQKNAQIFKKMPEKEVISSKTKGSMEECLTTLGVSHVPSCILLFISVQSQWPHPETLPVFSLFLAFHTFHKFQFLVLFDIL